MAANEDPLNRVPPLETELDEASIMSSLAHLQEMHISLRNLRETIPKVMDSVLVEPTSPDQLHSNFSQAANGAAQAIKHFTQLVDDSKTKEVMEKAKQSRMNNGGGITGWKVTEHEDWLNVRQEEGSDEADKEEGATAEAGDEIGVKDVNAALDKFRSDHLGVEASLDEDSRMITLHLPPPAQIKFQIQLNTTPEGHNSYGVDSTEKSKLHRAVLETIRARPRPNDLNYLLTSNQDPAPSVLGCSTAILSFRSSGQEKEPSNLMADMQASGWPCTQHAPEPIVRHAYGGVFIVCSATIIPNPSVSVPYPEWAVGFSPGPFNATPDIVSGPAVSPSCEVILHVRMSALKHTNEFFVLPKRFTINPANIVAIRILVARCLPVAPNRSLGLTSILFCDEDVGAFVGEDVFPPAPDTSMLIIWPYELPSIVLSPRADWPSWKLTAAP